MRLLAIVSVLGGCRLSFDEVPTEDAFVDVTPPADFTSGTRLRAIVYDGGGDTALQRAGWYDTVLAAECSVFRAEDGGMYCFPNRVGHFAQFADPACTVPVMRMRAPLDEASCPNSAQTGYVETSPRSEIYRYAQVGAQYTGTLYQDAGSGTCSMLTGNDGSYYSVTQYLPVSDLVRFEAAVVAAGPLGYLRTVATDGASELDPHHLVDMASGERCTLESNGYGEIDCAADAVPRGSLAFSDAGCSDPVVITFQQPDSPVVRVYETDECTLLPREATVGVELSTYYVNESGGCTMRSTSTTGVRAWTIASMQPSTPVASGTLALAGTGPIARGRWQFTTGHSLPDLLVDRARGDTCYPIQLSDTLELVCAPLWSGTSIGIYSDPACTTTINAYPSCAGAWRSLWYPTAPLQETCGGSGVGQSVRAYDVPITSTTYWYDDGVCTQIPSSVTIYRNSNADYPAAEMIPMTRRRE